MDRLEALDLKSHWQLRADHDAKLGAKKARSSPSDQVLPWSRGCTWVRRPVSREPSEHGVASGAFDEGCGQDARNGSSPFMKGQRPSSVLRNSATVFLIVRRAPPWKLRVCSVRLSVVARETGCLKFAARMSQRAGP